MSAYEDKVFPVQKEVEKAKSYKEVYNLVNKLILELQTDDYSNEEIHELLLTFVFNEAQTNRQMIQNNDYYLKAIASIIGEQK